MQQHPKLVVILGETASGKSALGLELAKKFNGEIICADSRTVYKGMDIGTSKPTPADQAAVPHHLLDIINPDQKFTAAECKRRAMNAIEDITARGKLPIMVGGTGLYIDAVLYDFGFSDSSAIRDAQNPRHLDKDAPRSKKALRSNTIVFGLQQTPEELKQRVLIRVKHMMRAGLKDEVARLAQSYGWAAPGLSAIGYQEWKDHFEGSASEAEIAAAIILHTMQYAKRQRTWFKRNKSIQWCANSSQIVEATTTFLNK